MALALLFPQAKYWGLAQVQALRVLVGVPVLGQVVERGYLDQVVARALGQVPALGQVVVRGLDRAAVPALG
jgi:hypothetical protein